MLLAFQTAYSQSFTVSGKVTSSDTGEEAIGTAIFDKKSQKNGAMADIDGMYRIDGMNKGDTLTFSLIGYCTREIVVEDSIHDMILDIDSVMISMLYSPRKKLPYVYNIDPEKLKPIFILSDVNTNVEQKAFPQSYRNIKQLADSLSFVTDVPYIANNEDPLFWHIVGGGRDIIPILIDKLTDTKKTKTAVRFFGGYHTVADLAYVTLQEIIKDIPTFDLLGVEFDQEGCGYCSYWHHVRKSKKNREAFRRSVNKWYDKNKNNLVWVNSHISLTGDCIRPPFVGGYYKVDKQ